MEGEDFIQQADSGASEHAPKEVSEVRKGDTVMLKGHPCRIVDMSTAKVGKHGAAKTKLTGIDIFTSNKYEEIIPGGHTVLFPNISRTEYTLLDIEGDGYMQLMAEDNSTREDIRLPTDETGQQIQAAFDKSETTIMVNILKAVGVEKVIGFKEI